MGGIGKPLRPIGGKGPCADMRDAVGEGVDIAVASGRHRRPVGKPVVGECAPSRGEEAENGADQIGMVGRCDLAIVGDLADVPEQGDFARGRSASRDTGLVAVDRLEDGDVVGQRRLGQALAGAAARSRLALRASSE